VLDGRLSIVATDDVTTSLEVKMRGKTIFDARGGHNGLETRLAYVFSEGVSKGGMSLQRFVDLTSANPAKILGMYPRKGAIAPGSDADIAILDPNIRKKVKVSDLHADSDFNIWEGWEFHGWPMVTI
jgi:dihydropyrimidinase